MFLDAGCQKLLQDMIVNRDRMCIGMNRSEVGQTISEMTSATYVKSLDHYKYLFKYVKMPGLKRGGRVVKSQPTTTKQSQINVTRQL